MAGRNTKCTPETTGVILRALPRVRYLSHAAAMAGVHEGTVHTWISRGKAALDAETDENPVPESEQPFAAFYLQVRAVQADESGKLVDVIADHAPEDWRAAAWLLERTDPRHFGKQATELAVRVEAPQAPVIDLRGVSSEELRNQLVSGEMS